MGALDISSWDAIGGIRWAFVNGRSDPSLSSLQELPKGALIEGETGAFVFLPRGLKLEKPIHLLYVALSGEKPVFSLRNLIVAEAGVQATVVETYVGGKGRYFTHAVTEIVAAEETVIDHYTVQREGAGGEHVASLGVRQGRSSRFASSVLSIGSSRARHEAHVALEGEGAECTLNGLYVATREEQKEHYTSIEHARPHTTSRELYKGILAGKATGIFNGRIVVRPEARQTDARQMNRNLLLSGDATVQTRPILEIFNNDVRCNHGATIGYLNADQIFYLRSRGIEEEVARRLLTHAFVADLLEKIRLQPLRMHLMGLFAEKLGEVAS